MRSDGIVWNIAVMAGLGSVLLAGGIGLGSSTDAIMTTDRIAMQGVRAGATSARVGTLTGAGGHSATGTVKITRDSNGQRVLTLSNIEVDRVPDGRVYLAKDAEFGSAVELGRLKQFSGTVKFPVPAGIRESHYNSVLIWCKRFHVEIGHALLQSGG